LELCQPADAATSRSFAVSPAQLSLCEKFFEPITFAIDLSGSYDDAITIELQDSDGNLIGQPIDANSGSDLQITLDDGSRFFDNSTSTLILLISDTQGSTSFEVPVLSQVDDLVIEQLSPGFEEVDVELEPTFRWSTTEYTIDFEITLADDTGAEVLNFVLDEVIDTLTLTTRLEPLTTYQWSVTAIGECSTDFVTDLSSFTTRSSTATIDISETDIDVYPNPVAELLTISKEMLTISKETAWTDEARFRLFSVQGVLMHQVQLNEQVSLIDLNDIPVGAYFYQITEGDDRFIQRLIIAR